MLRQYAKEQDLDGYLVTLKQPSVQAIMTYADNRGLRERVYWAYQTRASDQGPHANKYDNSERIEKIMALRHEAAQLLGFANAAAESLATKMASDAQRRSAHVLARSGCTRQTGSAAGIGWPCVSSRIGELKLDNLETWDVAYASEKLRQQRYTRSTKNN